MSKNTQPSLIPDLNENDETVSAPPTTEAIIVEQNKDGRTTEKQTKRRLDVWNGLKLVTLPSGETQAKCIYCTNLLGGLGQPNHRVQPMSEGFVNEFDQLIMTE